MKFIILMILLSSSSLLSLDEIKNCEFVTYKVTGKTRKEILESMEANTPVVKNFFGQTERTWSYKCNDLTFTCKVTMPEWEDEGLDDKLTEYWEKFYNSLILHEQGHVNITYNEFTRAKQIAKNKSCKEAEKVYSRAVKRINRMQLEHDRITDHGVKQGAVFSGSDSSDLFFAISYSPSTGAYGYAKNYSTKEEAETSAKGYCKETDCIIVAWAKNACVSLATSPKRAYGGAWGTSQKIAEKKALKLCSKYDNECRIATSVCK
ncbi:MAG: DUF4189 domain-containing protein [Leptospiraceae bacterium]|nr:DUF4189 domain-containing protein [Leptospiraceae bacterium]